MVTSCTMYTSLVLFAKIQHDGFVFLSRSYRMFNRENVNDILRE